MQTLWQIWVRFCGVNLMSSLQHHAVNFHKETVTHLQCLVTHFPSSNTLNDCYISACLNPYFINWIPQGSILSTNLMTVLRQIAAGICHPDYVLVFNSKIMDWDYWQCWTNSEYNHGKSFLQHTWTWPKSAK